MHKTITNGTLRHFADYTNLLIASKSVKKINREVNYNLRLMNDWLKTNKLCLNPSKTEIIIFKAKTRKITKHLNFRFSSQKIHLKNNAKYLGITIQDDLSLEIHVNNLLKKLRRSIAILSKVRYYAPKWLIRTIYYSLFNSHMIYGCQIWGQHKTSLVKRVMKLQEKAIRVINFKDNNAQVSNLFAQSKILKFQDFVPYRNINLVKNSIEKCGPVSFNDFFIQTQEIYQHNTRDALNNMTDIPQSRTYFCGTHFIRSKSAIAWNTIQYELGFNN